MAHEEELERVRRVLGELGWEPQEGRTPGSWFVDFGEPHLPASSAIAAITDSEQFLFYVVIGVAADAERRDEVARFVTRANYGLAIGDFELDYRDGQLQFRSSVDFEGVGLSEKLVANVILPALAAVDRYGEALVAVVSGEKDAEEAIAEAESA